MSESKQLGHDDVSGFEFAKEMLAGDVTAAVNFDRLQKHPKEGYIIFEYLLCEESQKVTPATSHPRLYWNKNKRKFIRLMDAARALNATLYLVNYAKKGTKAEDEILLIKVLEMDENGITQEEDTLFTREKFKQWFRQLNKECLEEEGDHEPLVKETIQKRPEWKCPNCGARVIQNKRGYFCEAKCGMKIDWYYGDTLSPEQVQNLLAGKSVSHSSHGREYTLFPEVVPDPYMDQIFYQWKSVKKR